MPPSNPSGWSPPTVEELRKLLPTLEIESLIGRGGMGAVYLGRQTALERRVAIKVLPESLARDDSESKFADRFKLEAKGLAGLDHPGIVSIFDFGETEQGHLYFVMEYVDGTDLKEYLIARGGSLPGEEAASIIGHVLGALDFAHSRGVVHRDIKPENVLIAKDGRVKIADFGLIKKVAVAGAAEPMEDRLTLTNVAVGTPDYIAPEVISGESPPDNRSDLYGVGVMLYRVITGKLPRGMFTLPSQSKEELKAGHDDVVSRALESDPAMRYQTAVEFKEALEKVHATNGTDKAEPSRSRRGRKLIAPGLEVLGLVAGLALTFLVTSLFFPEPSSPKSGGIDLMSVDTWRKEGEATWLLQSGTIRAGSLEGGLLRIDLPFDEFELTGEVLVEPASSGGVGFWSTGVDSSGKPKGGYLFHLAGSRGSQTLSGSLMMDSAISSSRKPILSDGNWTSFRLRVSATSLRGFLDEKPTFVFPPLPEHRRARGNSLFLLHKKSDDRIAFRALRISPLES